ncbi:iron ABC transporter permease [Rhodococcus sp. X156]|uniref:FecCD family ABC transporter permease n=1 Tax=Rhodococcus sp. X156 TaxID=2499145 RepID=UPI000FD9DD52|nr:iron ABC transporter permease [Rhodococcus sp. X156]
MTHPPGSPVSVAAPTRLTPRHLVIAVAGLVVVVVAAVLIGAVDLGPGRVFGEVWAQVTGGTSPLSSTEAAILWQLRVPRVLLGVLVGAALACCGAAFQGVFRNPLADPYLLGAAAGAGLGATLMIVLVTPDTLPIDPVPAGAFVGALVGVGLAWLVSQSAGSGPGVLVLAGVAVAAFLSAVQLALQTAHPDRIRAIYSFILGSLGTPGWGAVVQTAIYVGVSCGALAGCGRLLDVLSLGDTEASTLGIRPGRARLLIVVAASLGTAAAVSVSGLIGFVGLVVPHLVRLVLGGSFRVILPVSLLAGGAFLVLADLLARTVVSPAELPVGVVTAFVGGPFFALLLRRTKVPA